MNEELTDIVDSNNNVLRTIPRKVVHKGEKKGGEYLRYVNVFLINSKDEILIPKRSMKKELFPGCYDFSCAEHIQSGESYDDAIIRGLKEELNIEGVVPKDLGILTPREGVSNFLMNYILDYEGPIKLEEEEFESCEWISKEKIKQLLKEDPKKFKGDFPYVFDFCFNKSI